MKKSPIPRIRKMQSSAKSTIATGLVVFTKIKYDTCREFVFSGSKGFFMDVLQARRINNRMKQPFHKYEKHLDLKAFRNRLST